MLLCRFRGDTTVAMRTNCSGQLGTGIAAQRLVALGKGKGSVL